MKIWNVLGRLALAAALGSALTFPAYAKEKAYPDGIYVGDFSLGGLTKEEAEAGFSEYLAELEARTVTLKVDGAAVKTTAKELGYAAQNEDALKEAEDYAAGGCLIRQYMSERIWKRNRSIFLWTRRLTRQQSRPWSIQSAPV